MKYIDAEKLIAEIESHMEDCKLPDGTFPTTTCIVRYEELSCLRNLINSLQPAQLEERDKSLEEAAENYRRESYNAALKPHIDGPMPEYVGSIKAAFIAGAKWGAEYLKK